MILKDEWKDEALEVSLKLLFCGGKFNFVCTGLYKGKKKTITKY